MPYVVTFTINTPQMLAYIYIYMSHGSYMGEYSVIYHDHVLWNLEFTLGFPESQNKSRQLYCETFYSTLYDRFSRQDKADRASLENSAVCS